MDYKYIIQLLERYWECQTTLEEEQILKAFFSQDNIPASLMIYRDLFVYEHEQPKQDVLDDDFDHRMLELVGEKEPVKAVKISFSQRLRPLMKAAAVVAVVLTIGNALQHSTERTDGVQDAPGYQIGTGIGTAVAKDSAKVDSMKFFNAFSQQ